MSSSLPVDAQGKASPAVDIGAHQDNAPTTDARRVSAAPTVATVSTLPGREGHRNLPKKALYWLFRPGDMTSKSAPPPEAFGTS